MKLKKLKGSGRFIAIILLLFYCNVMKAQCYSDVSLSANAPLLNPCSSNNINVVTKFGLIDAADLSGGISLTYNFGDGSAMATHSYNSIASSTYYYDAISHNYTAPGTYTISCIFTLSYCPPTTYTTLVLVSGNCAACPMYSVLSTGFDRGNNVVIADSSLIIGYPTPDPYWYIVQSQNLDLSPGSLITYSNSPAYNIYPNASMPAPAGNSAYVSLNSTSVSTFTVPNNVTYRTYFNLPNPLPVVSKTYSLVMAFNTNNSVYNIRLNSTDIKPASFSPAAPLISVSSSTFAAFYPGQNYIDITVSDVALTFTGLNAEIIIYVCDAPLQPCMDCIGSFAPMPGKKYVLSAWAKEDNAPQAKTSYNYPGIDVLFTSSSGSAGPFIPSGNIIDGWQRIEGEFTIPSNASAITVRLNCATGDCYYDDVRIFPFDGSMKSYVYDPVNMRLVAELDERNYATLYEYDEEGKLVRVKKETEKGKMTIKENRGNTKK